VRRAAAVAPFVLLPGCTHGQEGTPGAWLNHASVALPPYVQRHVPRAEIAIQQWQLPSDNPWAAYSKLTLLSWLGAGDVDLQLPAVNALPGPQLAECAASRLARVGLPSDTMWVVDLRGAESVAFGAALSRWAYQPVSLALTFNNWPDQNEVVPAEETLAALIASEPQLPDPGTPGVPVFLLDSWRLAFASDVVMPDEHDNRYMLATGDLPDAGTLQSRGIHHVVYLVEDLSRIRVEEDDVHPILLGYQAAGMDVARADLRALCEPPAPVISPGTMTWGPSAWERWRFHFRCRIDERSTQASQQALLASSPGGFGGAQAAPLRLATGFSGSFHSFGG
jgi:hypothetical protein